MNTRNYIDIKNIVAEDFVNYKIPALFIGTASCDWKCLKEQGLPIDICQNCELAKQPNHTVAIDSLIQVFKINPITRAVVFGGLEPFLQYDQLYNFIYDLREVDNCDVVIYTGYNEDEIIQGVEELQESFENIIIKFGRYIPGHKPHFDKVLGVNLASDNQYARRIC